VDNPDPIRWRYDLGAAAKGGRIILRGVRRPQLPRPSELARLATMVAQMSDEPDRRNRSGWRPVLTATAAGAAMAAGIGLIHAMSR